MKRSRLLVVCSLIAALAVIFGISAMIVSRLRGDSIRFGDRRYSAQEFFQDPRVAALAVAAAAGRLGEVDSLLSQGADLNYVGLFDYTPLMWTIESGGLRGFEYLLVRGARLNVPNRSSFSAMALASGPALSADYLELALKHGGDPGFVEVASGDTPLFYAVRSGDIRRVQLLLDAGAKIDTRNKKEVTPLIECAFAGQYRCALLLLENGANPRLKDRAGTDFIALLQNDRGLPFWTPSYWWRRRVSALLALSCGRAVHGRLTIRKMSRSGLTRWED
jgi:hypothetical protein